MLRLLFALGCASKVVRDDNWIVLDIGVSPNSTAVWTGATVDEPITFTVDELEVNRSIMKSQLDYDFGDGNTHQSLLNGLGYGSSNSLLY